MNQASTMAPLTAEATPNTLLLRSINPSDGTVVAEYEPFAPLDIDRILGESTIAQREWTKLPMNHRSERLTSLSTVLRQHSDQLASLMTLEMGKPCRSGAAEIEKCALVCEYYADHGAELLADKARSSAQRKAWTTYRPLGTVLLVMPWNFPFWQVIRCAAPILMAGNAVVLKHASNVSGCALSIESKVSLPASALRSGTVGKTSAIRSALSSGNARVRYPAPASAFNTPTVAAGVSSPTPLANLPSLLG